MSKIKTESSQNLADKKVIELIVKPNSSKSSFSFDKDRKVFVFQVKSPPEDGKANTEILKMIKKETGKTAKIISGATSRKKLVKLE
jgi:uncharacterized protein (TIGR00251 family)